MSKEIQLYSKDNKYKCAIELADSKDRFGCPDHSRIILFEERDDKIYLIADAKDRLLETEKDKRIAELEQDLEFTTKTANELIEIKHKLEHQLEEKDKEIERLKVFEKAYYFNQTQVSQESMDLLLQNAYQVHNGTQLAIQELEKVKEEMDLNGNSYCEIRQGTSPHNPTDYAWFNYVKFRNYLNQQIKELKGE